MYAKFAFTATPCECARSKENQFRNLGIFNSNLCKEIAAKM